MVWLLITALAIVLYQRKRRVHSLVLLLFLITSGFQLVPPSAFETSFGLNKGADFGVLGIVVLFLLHYKKLRDFVTGAGFARRLIAFLAFLAIAIAYSIVVFGYDYSAVVRASRHFLVLLLFFLLRNLTADERENVWVALRRVTVVQGIIFLLQIPLGVSLLNTGLYEGAVQEMSVAGISFTRYYSFPLFAPLFFFEGLWKLRFTGPRHLLTMSILGLSLIATLHRGLIFALVIATVILVLKNGLGRLKFAFALIAIALAFPAAEFIIERLQSGFGDFLNAIAGGYEMGRLTTDTFSFRLAHLLERVLYAASSLQHAVFGAGLLTEDAPQAEQLGFIMGYPHPWGGFTQIDTADIAWSLLIIRLGFVGTGLYILTYLYALKGSWQSIETRYGAAGFGFLLTYLILTFTSSLFVDPGTMAGMCLIACTAIRSTNLSRS